MMLCAQSATARARRRTTRANLTKLQHTVWLLAADCGVELSPADALAVARALAGGLDGVILQHIKYSVC